MYANAKKVKKKPDFSLFPCLQIDDDFYSPLETDKREEENIFWHTQRFIIIICVMITLAGSI